MDLDLLRKSPVGRLVPVEVHDPDTNTTDKHWAFVPDPLPDWVDLSRSTTKLVTEATRAIGRLDGLATQLPNPDLLARPIVRREAQSTSALEGTYAPLREVFAADYLEKDQMSADLIEIRNYVRAAELAITRVAERGLSINVLFETHETLMKGSRGDTWESGRVRTQPVWVGKRHDRIYESRYVPPPPGDVLRQGFYDWEKWIHADSDLPLIVKIALAHYQFETLHPFHDGNGRLGRLIAVLQLLEEDHLKYPFLALSPWFEARKDQYTDLLLQTSATGDFEQWTKFFLDAVIAQANASALRAQRLLDLRKAFVEELRARNTKGAAIAIAEHLVVTPVLTIGNAQRIASPISWQGAKNAIERLVAVGILEEIDKAGKTRFFSTPRALHVLASEDGV